MRRLLTQLMILVVVIAHGSSISAAICRHHSLAEHVAARDSHDFRIAGVAAREEAAAATTSKKGTPADSGSVPWPADMLPAFELTAPFDPAESLERYLADSSMPPGSAVNPLLEPPTA